MHNNKEDDMYEHNAGEGRFGEYGGMYIPETLMNAVIELDRAYRKYKDDAVFRAELSELFSDYAGRPSRLYFARNMTKEIWEERRSISNARISIIQVPIRSTMR